MEVHEASQATCTNPALAVALENELRHTEIPLDPFPMARLSRLQAKLFPLIMQFVTLSRSMPTVALVTLQSMICTLLSSRRTIVGSGRGASELMSQFSR